MGRGNLGRVPETEENQGGDVFGLGSALSGGTLPPAGAVQRLGTSFASGGFSVGPLPAPSLQRFQGEIGV